MKDSPTDQTKDGYTAVPEGFAEDKELFENNHIQTIQIGSQTSTTQVSVLIERANGISATRTASIELNNLVEYNVRDELYDESTGELDYSELSEELQDRVSALLDFSVVGEPADDSVDPDGEESDSDLLQRETGLD